MPNDIRITFKRQAFEAQTEVGSFSELVGLLQDEKSNLIRLFGSEMETIITSLDGEGAVPLSGELNATAAPQANEAAPAKRGRGKQKDAATAVAPAPLAVPGAAATPTPPAPTPVDTTLGDNGIPKFLDRTTAASPPPPPLLPAAPPVAPEAPKFVLGNKIADDLQKRLSGSADDGKALRDWLMPHVTAFAIPSATIEEVISLIRFTVDEKVAHLAAPLGIS